VQGYNVTLHKSVPLGHKNVSSGECMPLPSSRSRLWVAHWRQSVRLCLPTLLCTPYIMWVSHCTHFMRADFTIGRASSLLWYEATAAGNW